MYYILKKLFLLDDNCCCGMKIFLVDDTIYKNFLRIINMYIYIYIHDDACMYL